MERTLSAAVRAVVVAAALAFGSAAYGDANVLAPPQNNADFDLGFEAVRARDWDRAVYHLAIAAKAESSNADVQNLLGFAYRNQKKYDLAFSHYGAALKLDPNHRGAHEYVGEAYVMTGNKAKAQEHLAALERICGRNCDEYRDLARAIAQAK